MSRVPASTSDPVLREGTPMKIGVFSDVHARLAHLQAVLADIAEHGISEVWCLGDFASGGPQPWQVFDLVMESCSVVLVGNHEWFVIDRAWEKIHAPWARNAAFAYQQLGGIRLRALAELKPYREIPEHGVELAHGSLDNHWGEGVDDPNLARMTLARARQPLVLLGHTHKAMYCRAGAKPHETPTSVPVELDREYVLDSPSVLNPGAAYDGDHRARWMELASGNGQRTAVWHRLEVRDPAAA